MVARPACYVRQSSTRLNRSEASPETQREATLARAQADHPGVPVRQYADLGRSGYRDDVVREDYDRLVAAIKDGEVTHLYVYYISRLTRREPRAALAEWLPLLATGLTIVSVTEGVFGPDNTMDLIHLVLRMDAAHNESRTKSVAIKGAKDLARAAGGHVGGAPYGFRTVERMARTPTGAPIAIRVLTVNPAEARVLRIAVRAVIWGHAVHAVARYFNRRGMPTRGATVGRSRAGSAWFDRALLQRLRDPRIAGLPAVAVLDAKGNTLSYHASTGTEGERVLPAPDGAIIDPDTFWRLQARLNDRRRRHRMRAPDRAPLLSGIGILYCECGASMKARRYLSSPELATRDAYQCAAPSWRHSNTISLRALDEWVRMRIDQFLRTIDADPDGDAAAILAEATRRYGAAMLTPEAASQRAAVTAELADASAALARQTDALATATGAAADALTRAITATGARVDALTARLAQLDAQAHAALPIDLWTSSEHGDESAWWDSASVTDRQDFVRLFVDRLTVRRAASKGGRPTRANPWGMVAARVDLTWAGAG